MLIAQAAACQKAPVQTKQRVMVKKTKSVPLGIVELCLSEGISQSVSQQKIQLNNFF